MGDSLSMFGVPTHARLIGANTYDLLDTTFGRTAANLKSSLHIAWIVHTWTLVFKVGNRSHQGIGGSLACQRERVQFLRHYSRPLMFERVGVLFCPLFGFICFFAKDSFSRIPYVVIGQITWSKTALFRPN